MGHNDHELDPPKTRERKTPPKNEADRQRRERIDRAARKSHNDRTFRKWVEREK